MGKEVNWPWSVKQHTMLLSYPQCCLEQRWSQGCLGTDKILYIPPLERLQSHTFSRFRNLSDHEEVFMCDTHTLREVKVDKEMDSRNRE